MNVSKLFKDIVQYFSEGMVRIFGPSDDAYPNIGIQPFEGEPDKKFH